MIAFILVIVIILVIGIIVFVSARSPPSLESLFNNTSGNPGNIGGFFVSNFSQDGFRKMLAAGDITIQDASAGGCSVVNQKSCVAFAYMRRDLTPTFFMFPGINTYVPCGIIVDPQKIWPLVTLMAIVDADTDNRNNCINESGSPILVYNPAGTSNYDACARASLIAKYGPNSQYLNYAVFIPSKESSNASCSDQTCKYIHSGGSINQWLMNESSECINGNFSDCYMYEEVPYQNVPDEIKQQVDSSVTDFLIQRTSCDTCRKPYLCVFKDYKTNEKYKTVYEDKIIANYIGENGEGFGNLYAADPTNIDTDYISIAQCRFEKRDWNSWIRVLHNWYKLMSNNLQTNGNSYLLANPDRPIYIENEVNIYVEPNFSSDASKLQNKIFQDSIIGFYYTDATCEEQLESLNGIKTESNGATYTTAIDRCDKFWNDDDSSMNTEKRRKWESENMADARQLVHKVAAMFGRKHGRKLPVYKSRADSNSFPNLNSISKALRGETKLNFLELDK